MKRLMKKLAKCIAKKLGKSLKKKLVKSLIKRLKKSLEKKFGKRLGKKLGKKIGKKLENRFIKDKRGMTLMEIVVALTLLMLVIVFTTPVLLSSYGSLYTAGDYTKDTYEAKSEIEDTLATRNTLNVYENFKVNFESIGEIAEINGKRAVSSLYNSLETVFTGGRAHVAIISSKVINDDKITQTVVLQTTNVSFTSPDQVTSNCAHLNTITPNSVKKVDVTAMLPDKSTDVLSNIYNPGKYRATVKIVSANPETGRIIITVSDADFTMSPVKIMVTYLDENDDVQTTSCYLTIKTPTIMMAGTTNFGKKYYTTTGVETLTDDSGSKYTRLQVDGRVMRIDGASGTAEVPAGTVFKSVNWLTEYATGSSTGSNEDVEFVDSSYEPSYYVLTGTNGAIYRTYTFTNVNTVVGKVNLDTTDAPYSTGQVGKDVIGLTEEAYVLDDAQATTVYPATWSGDFSHIYGYSAYNTNANYKGQDTWYTQTGTNTGVGNAGYFSNKAVYGYYYNGYGTNFSYATQNSKKISYILTELPYALRVGGYLNEAGNFDGGINRIWERPITMKNDGSDEYNSQNEEKVTSGLTGYYYKKAGENFTRCTIISDSRSDWNYDDDYLNEVPTYWDRYGTQKSDLFTDANWAQLRVKAMTTISPTFLYEQRGNNDSNLSSFKFVYNNTTNQSKVAVTDAVYIPATATTSGGVFYIGTVAAYAVINQADNISTNWHYAAVIQQDGSRNVGSMTTYYVMGNDEGTKTSVYKYSSSDYGFKDGNQTIYQSKSQIAGTGIKANSDESREFYVTRNYGGTSQQLFSDVLFTMGYTSNREMVYSKIVYGKNESGVLLEAYKSYEPLYFLSHYDDTTDTHVPNVYMNDLASVQAPGTGSNGYTYNITGGYYNVPDNDYYNVWFPGEMYNLTKVANKDGITVAVGYAVSGSTYTYMNPNPNTDNSELYTNASTALGNIYNDGVLAAMVPGKSTSFTNLLYFKDTENFDDYSLADGSLSYYTGAKTYRNMIAGGSADWSYGTHQRDSVQFTAVDISVQYTTSGSTELASYYAYYADNKGRVFRSLVASKTTYVGSSSTPTLVSHISDKGSPTSTAPSYMQRIKLSDGSDFSDYFDKITTIKCQGDYIVISGHSRADLTKWNVAVGKVQSDGSVIFNRVSLDLDGTQPYQVEDMLILDGYVYFVGQSTADNKGWMYAHSLEDMASKSHNGLIAFNANHFAGSDQIPDKIYAIDGHGTT